MRSTIGLVATTAVLAWAQSVPTKPDIRNYRTWKMASPGYVNMAPRIASLCVGPQSWDQNPANPHVRTLFRVYVNTIGAPYLSRNPSRLPVGTVLVKEKFELPKANKREPGAQAKPVLLTAMMKRAEGKWEYFVGDGGLTWMEVAWGGTCRSCHEKRAKDDFVFLRTYRP